jgi:hypothetical protein
MNWHIAGIIFFSCMTGLYIGIPLGAAIKEREQRRRAEEEGRVPDPVARAAERREVREGAEINVVDDASRCDVRRASEENIPVTGNYGVLDDGEITLW